MEEILNKYNIELIKRLNKDNINKIIFFLENNNRDYIETLLSDYLDLFSIDYDEFVKKYSILNKNIIMNF